MVTRSGPEAGWSHAGAALADACAAPSGGATGAPPAPQFFQFSTSSAISGVYQGRGSPGCSSRSSSDCLPPGARALSNVASRARTRFISICRQAKGVFCECLAKFGEPDEKEKQPVTRLFLGAAFSPFEGGARVL